MSNLNNLSDPPPDAARDISTLFDHLLATRLSLLGRPYSLTDISQATGLSVPYLSQIRSGKISAVPFEKVELLAKFFGVPLEYFSREVPPPRSEGVEDAVHRILADHYGPDLLVHLGALNSRERALLLQMVERAHDLVEGPATVVL